MGSRERGQPLELEAWYELLDLGARLWDTAYALDEIRGDTEASDLVAASSVPLLRGASADVDVLGHLAEALEADLARQRAAATRGASGG